MHVHFTTCAPNSQILPRASQLISRPTRAHARAHNHTRTRTHTHHMFTFSSKHISAPCKEQSLSNASVTHCSSSSSSVVPCALMSSLTYGSRFNTSIEFGNKAFTMVAQISIHTHTHTHTHTAWCWSRPRPRGMKYGSGVIDRRYATCHRHCSELR